MLPSKRWGFCNQIRQESNTANCRPIVVNFANLKKPNPNTGFAQDSVVLWTAPPGPAMASQSTGPDKPQRWLVLILVLSFPLTLTSREIFQNFSCTLSSNIGTNQNSNGRFWICTDKVAGNVFGAFGAGCETASCIRRCFSRQCK